MTAAELLPRLANVTGGGPDWTACCPAHPDDRASLSIRQTDDGKVLLKCFAGCSFEAITAALGLKPADLMGPNGSWRKDPPRERITLEALARDKGLPPDLLRDLGCADLPNGGVRIPYRDLEGREVVARLRYALRAGDGSRWPKGAKLTPYGLDRLAAARGKGFLILVEGESDAWTLWHHGIPALGTPGADMAKTLEPEHLEGIRRVYLIQEPDQGGETFRRGIAARLRDIGWAGELRVIPMADHGHKDPNAWHKADPAGFLGGFRATAKAAAVVDLAAAPPEPAKSCDVEAELRALAALPPLEYDRRRQEAAKALGIRTSTLDAEVERRRPEEPGSEKLTGTAVDLADPEPWAGPVVGADLADELEEVFSRYIVLPQGAAAALALWTLHSHAHDASAVSPILAITSPEKRCGKSTLLSLLGALTRRPLPVANVTVAALFRAAEQWQPTLLIDEADTFLRDSEDLRGILNSGHTRGAAFVLRVVGDACEVRKFSTWTPKAIALIGRMHPTLMDRSIEIRMRRKRPEEEVDRLRLDRLDALADLPRRSVKWAEGHLGALRRADPPTPSGLNDRAADNWRTLLAIADTLGGHWPAKARAAVVELVSEDDGDEAAAVLLLQDLRDLFERHGSRLSSAGIVKDLEGMEDRPWPEWKAGRPITARQLARLLKPFGIIPCTRRDGPGTFKGYTEDQFRDAWARYLSPLRSVTPSQPSNGAENGEARSVTPSAPVPDRGEGKTAPNQRCDGVTDRQPLPLEEVWA